MVRATFKYENYLHKLVNRVRLGHLVAHFQIAGLPPIMPVAVAAA
jgi:hypothetical protein